MPHQHPQRGVLCPIPTGQRGTAIGDLCPKAVDMHQQTTGDAGDMQLLRSPPGRREMQRAKASASASATGRWRWGQAEPSPADVPTGHPEPALALSAAFPWCSCPARSRSLARRGAKPACAARLSSPRRHLGFTNGRHPQDDHTPENHSRWGLNGTGARGLAGCRSCRQDRGFNARARNADD